MKLEELSSKGYMTPPGHEKFMAKTLIQKGGKLRDAAIAYIEPGGGSVESHTHPYDHNFMVVKGEITVYEKQGSTLIEENQGYVAKGNTPHYLRNTGKETAILIGITTEAEDE